MQPTFADFRVSPPRLGNAEIRMLDCIAALGHLKVDAGGHVELDFALDKGEAVVEATLKVTALVSKAGPRPGFAPMTILVNDRELVTGLTIPGGGDLPQGNVFAVSGEWLRPGLNTLTVSSSPESGTMLWIYQITLDSVYERDRSERAIQAQGAAESVFIYDTLLRADVPGGQAEDWEPGFALLLNIERGEQASPTQLSWRAADGSEAAVVFQGAMGAFMGHYRAADGALFELRGELADRLAYPQGTEDAAVHVFRTREGWGGGWHGAGELRLLVEYGDVPVERISWRDERNNSGSVDIRADGSGFVGFYQRVNEGPIGYRGVSVGTIHPVREEKGADENEDKAAIGGVVVDDGQIVDARTGEPGREQPPGPGELLDEIQTVGRHVGQIAEQAVDKLTRWLEGR